MKNFFDKIFLRSNNLGNISQKIKNLTKNTPAINIFEAINSYSTDSEIRYVGGCIRKIIKDQTIDDIDFATNLEPNEVCDALEKKNISFFKTGIKYGTVSAVIDSYKFEITTLREDLSTDGRHAIVKFTKDWKKDASRRDFTINAIYSDSEGNLFDPYNGVNDLKKGYVNFIGETNNRIKEDYLRILRYVRFFLDYSNAPHDLEIIKKIKINVDGVSNISKDRLFDELKKIISLDRLEKLSKDKKISELIKIIFPELINLNIFSNLKLEKKKILNEADIIFFLALMIVDDKDNADYFLYKYNLSKIDQKRITIINNFFKETAIKQLFTEKNLNRIFYYNGKEAVEDILKFRIIRSKKFDRNLAALCDHYKNKSTPIMPIAADLLITKYKIPQGKQLGFKLKKIEEEWVNNNFRISDQQVENILNN